MHALHRLFTEIMKFLFIFFLAANKNRKTRKDFVVRVCVGCCSMSIRFSSSLTRYIIHKDYYDFVSYVERFPLFVVIWFHVTTHMHMAYDWHLLFVWLWFHDMWKKKCRVGLTRAALLFCSLLLLLFLFPSVIFICTLGSSFIWDFEGFESLWKCFAFFLPLLSSLFLRIWHQAIEIFPGRFAVAAFSALAEN